MFNSRYHDPINEKTGASLIIVCADKYREHANYLQQLISQDDPKFSGTTGVTSAIYLEKEYSQNRPTLSSHQYLLFIGPSDECKKQKETIPDKYHYHCLHYGWLGKIGTIYVDDTLNRIVKPMISYALDWPVPDRGVLSYDEQLNVITAKKKLYRILIKSFYENDLKSFMKLKLPDCPETV